MTPSPDESVRAVRDLVFTTINDLISTESGETRSADLTAQGGSTCLPSTFALAQLELTGPEVETQQFNLWPSGIAAPLETRPAPAPEEDL